MGLAAKILGIDTKAIQDAFVKRLPLAIQAENHETLKQGNDYLEKSIYHLSPLSGTPRKFYFGNEAVGLGAIEAGLGFYSAYPMTPASSLIDVISEDSRVTFFQ